MDIARAAARLFVGQGLRATRAEDIARAAGVAPRTFYRYFATKEEAVAPLYALGAERWIEAVREAPAALSPPQALEHAVRHTLAPGAGVSAASWEAARALIRLAETSPALRKVWADVCHRSERALGDALAERAPSGLRGDADAGATTGVGASADNVAEAPVAGPRLRFAAATAGAAVRVAVEHWAASADDPARALDLTLANLEVLRRFTWDEAPGEGE
ncbi:TetR/AcrR family transcriptional regulator [Streptomyces sp. NPDC059701]|uniref:TetR/AcrR family transcriptional regulator n=1 Tax=Streptomyces sp. NPDC059701 TaxID=3346914 RepID=UPI0036812D3E